MDKKTSERFFNLRVKEKEDLESRLVRYYADFLIISALLLLCGIGGTILYAIFTGGRNVKSIIKDRRLGLSLF